LATGEKAPDAFRTIGELSAELGVAQHILRYWETKFPQLKPLQRAGNRRYYRPADVALARRIHGLLNEQGYTVKGVQKLLRSKDDSEPQSAPPTAPTLVEAAAPSAAPTTGMPNVDLDRLKYIRDRLAAALEA
jgi:DNA-binding transcriptional MerR regulator